MSLSYVAATTTDVTSVVIDAVSAFVAIVAAAIAGLSARDSKRAALEARAPALITTDPPTVVNEAESLRVRFTARNEGKGAARLVSCAVRDVLAAPTRESRHKMTEAEARETAAEIVPLDSYFAFSLSVSADWFRQTIDQSGDWAFEIEYTDLPPTRKYCSRFGVHGGAGPVLTRQLHSSRRL